MKYPNLKSTKNLTETTYCERCESQASVSLCVDMRKGESYDYSACKECSEFALTNLVEFVDDCANLESAMNAETL